MSLQTFYTYKSLYSGVFVSLLVIISLFFFHFVLFCLICLRQNLSLGQASLKLEAIFLAQIRARVTGTSDHVWPILSFVLICPKFPTLLGPPVPREILFCLYPVPSLFSHPHLSSSWLIVHFLNSICMYLFADTDLNLDIAYHLKIFT